MKPGDPQSGPGAVFPRRGGGRVGEGGVAHGSKPRKSKKNRFEALRRPGTQDSLTKRAQTRE